MCVETVSHFVQETLQETIDDEDKLDGRTDNTEIWDISRHKN